MDGAAVNMLLLGACANDAMELPATNKAQEEVQQESRAEGLVEEFELLSCTGVYPTHPDAFKFPELGTYNIEWADSFSVTIYDDYIDDKLKDLVFKMQFDKEIEWVESYTTELPYVDASVAKRTIGSKTVWEVTFVIGTVEDVELNGLGDWFIMFKDQAVTNIDTHICAEVRPKNYFTK